MDRKYLAFDLVVAKVVPEGEEWNAHRPLGISCAAMLASDTGELVTWHGRESNGGTSGRMSPEEIQIVVRTLVATVEAGYDLVTWNGLSLGLPDLAEGSGLESECRFLASRHADMMFHVYCIKGQYLDLDAAAMGMGLHPSASSMVREEAPLFWSRGRHQLVLDHLGDAVRTIMDVALTCDRRKVLLWTNKRGSSHGMDLPAGWLTVPEAAAIKGIDHTQWRWDR